MARIGQNPNRTAGAAQWTPIVMTVCTHLPNLQGYHSQRMEVVQTCLNSMKEHAGAEHTIIVWDSAS